MANGLLLGENERVAAWAFETFGYFPTPVNMAIGIIHPEKGLVGAILLQNFNGTNLELSYYGANTVTAGIVKTIAKIVIHEFNASRLTVVTSKRNHRIIKALPRFGFRLEGAQRRFYGH